MARSKKTDTTDTTTKQRKPIHYRPADPAAKIIRPYNIKHETGLSLSTVLRLEAAGAFPQRVKLSVDIVDRDGKQRCPATGWKRSDIEAWQASRQAA